MITLTPDQADAMAVSAKSSRILNEVSEDVLVERPREAERERVLKRASSRSNRDNIQVVPGLA